MSTLAIPVYFALMASRLARLAARVSSTGGGEDGNSISISGRGSSGAAGAVGPWTEDACVEESVNGRGDILWKRNASQNRQRGRSLVISRYLLAFLLFFIIMGMVVSIRLGLGTTAATTRSRIVSVMSTVPIPISVVSPSTVIATAPVSVSVIPSTSPASSSVKAVFSGRRRRRS